MLVDSDYYPFGMVMPEWSYANESYVYGYNGKEKTDEICGEDNVYNYGFRICEVRIGRFLSVDPLTKNYPFYSPYHFAGNSPIQAIDLDGLEPVIVHALVPSQNRPKLKQTEWYQIMFKGGGSTYDMTSFAAAAAYNTAISNSDAYSSFRAKTNYYSWAQNEVEKMDIKSRWFAMDAKIVSLFEVGLTDLDPGVVLSSGTKDFLKNIGSMVLKANMGVFNQLSFSKGFNGKSGGTELDQELLYNEQTLIQDYMSSLDSKKLKDYLSDYNKGFKIFQALKEKDHYLNVASSIIGGDINFGSLKDRMVIGRVLMYQMSGKTIDEEAKKQILIDATADAERYYNSKKKK